MKTQVLKPGYLVSLKTSIRGGVNYQRIDIAPDHQEESGARVAEWQTKREIPDPQEYETAVIMRSKARSLITAVCCSSSFGLLCPLDKEQELTDAITAARELAAKHNAQSQRTQIEVFILAGRVAQSDVEAARAIGAEVRELLDAMQSGIAAANPEAIREAATKARQLGGMLSEGVQGQVTAAIEEARRAAREIVKRVEKAGETAAAVVSECSVSRIEAARFAFLDLDAQAEVTPEAPAARGIELETAPFCASPVNAPVNFEV